MVQMKSVSQEEIDQELEQDGNSFAVDELTNAKSIDSMVMDPDNVENILEYQFSVSKSQSHSDISNEISLPSKAAERLDRVKEVLSGEDDEDNLSDSSSGPLPEKKLFRPATTADLYEAVVLERSMSEDLTQKLRASRDIQPDAGSADCSVLGGDMSIEAIASASFDELALSQMNKDQPAKQEGGQAEPSFLSPGSTASSAHVASNHKPSWTVTEESIFSPASTMSSEDLAKVLADGGFASPIQSQSNIIPMPPVPPPIGFGMMPAVAAENKRQSIGDKRR